MTGDHGDAGPNRRLAGAVLAAASLPPAVVAGLMALLAGPVVAVVVLVVVAAAVAAFVWTTAERRAVSAIGGRDADARADARFVNLVEGLGAAGGVSPPRLLVVDDPALNAAALGRDPRRGTLVVTSGLLGALTRVELEGLLAAQLVRIKRGDTLPGTLASAAGPLARRACRSALPAQGGDLAAVALTRYPPGLASALEKVATGPTALVREVPAVAALWLADPGQPAGPGQPGDRAVRAPLEARIAALREL
ncbi:MAG: hypothetical protein ACRDY0_04720 [Acidimicrobiales bacterium]